MQKRKHLYIRLLACLLITLMAKPSLAQSSKKYASSEDVAIAFYKTANIKPNFENWVKKQEDYRHTPLGLRPEFMASELARLQNSYNTFNPETDYLTVRTTATIQTNEITLNEGETIQTISLNFGDSESATYLPYSFMDKNIMVIPDKFNKLKTHRINKIDYALLNNHLEHIKPRPFIMQLKAVKSDTNKPYNVDGIDQWAMITEIVSMETWNSDGSLLWEYSAPWYVAPNEQKIRNLYVDPAQNEADNLLASP